jgi:hypothetical protein
MNFHSIWIGSAPHRELIEKIMNKAFYLNGIFSATKNTFYLWTTSDLMSGIRCRLITSRVNF